MLTDRKFLMAMYFGTAIFFLCWLKRVSGEECVTAVAALSGLYKAAAVATKLLGGDN